MTDGRFTVRQMKRRGAVKIELQKGSLYARGGRITSEKIGVIAFGFDPAQLTVAEWKAVRKAAGSGKCRALSRQDGRSPAQTERRRGELAAMRKAAAILADAVMEGPQRSSCVPGMRESELGAEIEYQMRKRGAQRAVV